MRFHCIGGEWDGHRLDAATPGLLAGVTYQKLMELTENGTLGKQVYFVGKPEGIGKRKGAAYEVTEHRADGEIVLRPTEK